MSSLEELKERAAAIISARRAVGERLATAKRTERAALLEQHRMIKESEYAVEREIALAKLSTAISEEKSKDVAIGRQRLQRLDSRLSHADWLLWTRSIWKFKDMESDAKTGKHPAQFS